tara:strand:+ start:129 stop:467 length:339 start_codon:yes stop_codon:yes gene_type:complete
MNDSDTAVNDFEYARRVKHDLLAKGSEALDDMMEVARSTEHPRAYEVLSNMMKNVGDVSDSLLELHKKRKDLKKKDEQPALPGTTNNNVFVGSTADLQRMLRNDPIDVTPKN